MASNISLIVFSLLLAHTCAQLEDLSVEDSYMSCGRERECVPSYLCANALPLPYSDVDCNYSEVCCEIADKIDEKTTTFLFPDHVGCGWRNVYGVGFRISGDTDNEAQFAEFPWMVPIVRKEDVGGTTILLFECGGALIAPNVVLTAAHCVNNLVAHQLVVRGGEWDTKKRDEILYHVDKPVKEIVSHEKYNKVALYNDVALLILEESFDWQLNIRPICLPQPNTTFDHSRCSVTSWGKDKFGRDGKYHRVLKEIVLPVIPAETCQNQLRQTRLGSYFNLHESFLCAGGEKDKGTCTGDGGFSLVCPMPGVEGRYYQAGIVSWGVGCAEENVPGVYANVANLLPWISEKLSARDIQFLHFTP